MVAYNGGRRAEVVPNAERFRNRRAAAYWMLRQRLEEGAWIARARPAQKTAHGGLGRNRSVTLS